MYDAGLFDENGDSGMSGIDARHKARSMRGDDGDAKLIDLGNQNADFTTRDSYAEATDTWRDDDDMWKYHVHTQISDADEGDSSLVERVISVHGMQEDVGPERDDSDDELISVLEDNEVLRKTTPRPIWFFRFVTERPATAFMLGVFGHIFIAATTIILIMVGYDIFPTEFEMLPVDLKNLPWANRDYAWRNRFKYSDRILGIELPYVPGSGGMDGIEIIFADQFDNIFTKTNLQLMERIENSIISLPLYEQYCQVSPNKKCTPPVSVVRFFDGTLSHINPVFNDSNFNNIESVLYTAFTTKATKEQFNYGLSKDSEIKPSSARSTLTRMYIPLTHSLVEVTKRLTFEESISRVTNFIRSSVKPKLEQFKEETSTVDITYYNRLLYVYELKQQAFQDLKLAGGSVIFIFGYMWFHTASLWITTWAVISILSSFLATNLLYRVVLGFQYFGLFHVLALFIILGIGADDLFVFYDTWKATSTTSFSTLAHRLSVVYRKSAITMLVTSLTTMAAFAATSVSQLLLMKSFGIFSAVLVIIDYISVIIFFPTVIVFHHVKILNCCSSCCDKCRTPESQFQKNQPVGLIRFFKDTFYSLITHDKIRWILLSIFGVMIVCFAATCSRIKPASGRVQLFKPGSNFAKALEQTADSFKDGTSPIVWVYLMWGIKKQDMSACGYGDYKCQGKPIYDESFDPNSIESQEAFKILCNRMNTFTDEEIDKYRIQIDHSTGRPKIDCFARSMDDFLKDDIAEFDALLPWDLNKTKQVLELKFPSMISKFNFTSTFHEYLNVAYNYWIIGELLKNQTNDVKHFSGLIGEQKGPNTIQLMSKPVVINVGNKIKTLLIRVQTNINGLYLGYKDGAPVIEAWEQFMKDELAKMPKSLQSGFQLSPYGTWNWVYAQKELQNNAINGILLGLGLTTLVLIISIQNIITSLLASFTISMVTVCVLGMIPLLGWKLGVLVSMNMCLLVGLSVDYIVHLAEGYSMSKNRDRKSRVRDSLESMATSVFSGACTTLGASVFMLFAQLVFFFEFGVFMFVTIGFSLLFSLAFFMTLLAIVGPENDTGDIRRYIRILISALKRGRGIDSGNNIVD